MMTERELQSLIERELRTDALAEVVELAADLGQLAAAGLVDIARASSGELRVAVRG
jgi:hypothetical protein